MTAQKPDRRGVLHGITHFLVVVHGEVTRLFHLSCNHALTHPPYQAEMNILLSLQTPVGCEDWRQVPPVNSLAP